jgi:hypothetical protein
VSEPLSDEKLAEVRAVIDAGELLGPNDIRDLLDALDAGREIARANHDELVAANRELSAAVDFAQAMADAVGAETEGDTWVEKAANWRAAHGALTKGPSPVVRTEMLRVIEDWVRDEMTEDHDDLADRLSFVIAAAVSEAPTAAPEPLVVGTLVSMEPDPNGHIRVEIVGPDDGVTVDVGTRVAIYPPDLADQVCDDALDREGTQRELDEVRHRIDLLKEGFDTDDPVLVGKAFDSQARKLFEAERELDAMTTVARRLSEGLVPTRRWDGTEAWGRRGRPALSTSPTVTDAERQALQTLSEAGDETV